MPLPPDQLYRIRVVAIPGSYAQRVVHRAVLLPLYGPRRRPADYGAAAVDLVARWRSRAEGLVAAG